MTTETLSKKQAQKLVLQAQQVLMGNSNKKAIEATLGAIQHLGYIQIDTISAIQRAHHHTLWNRNSEYKLDHIDKLIADKKVFEYWSHAAAYLPMSSYRFSLPRKHAIANGSEKHWYKVEKKLLDAVLKRIEKEGPLMAKDFEYKGKKLGDWQSKSSKQALEQLFMQGALMITERRNFHKVYDLTERVLPKDIDTTTPSTNEYIRFLIVQYLAANGLGQAGEIAYLLKNTKAIVNAALNEMFENKELIKVQVNALEYFALPHILDLLKKPLARNKVKILSPFDNLLIQRKRMQALFDFDYTIECYVPEAKRVFGYFSLPILWDGKLLARMDCKVDRKQKIMHINSIFLEPSLNINDQFLSAFQSEFYAFMEFNSCNSFQIHKASSKVVYQQILKWHGAC